MARARGWRWRRTGGCTPYGAVDEPVTSVRRGCGCRRQVCLVETGCCLVQVLGCGPRSALLAPSLVRRSVRAAGPRRADGGAEDRLLRVALEAITIYQSEIGPHLAPCCRFTPGCSSYAATALQELGLRRGGWLATRRLLRCHPWAAGGYDPVPPSPSSAA
jgi:uncharacterized protein